MIQLTLQQAESFAPDSGTLGRAKKIAKASKYQKLGTNQRAIWGIARGSSDYEMMVDLQGPAFRCGCPVKKLPCKHIMGMLLLVSSDPSLLVESDPPEEVTQWLVKRDAASARKKNTRAVGMEAETVKDPAAKARRVAQRSANVDQGIEELRCFLEDTLVLGLSESSKRTHDVWERVRRRLMDAQASGLARQLDSLRLQLGSGPGWAEAAVGELVQLNLLISAYRERAQLTQEQQDTLSHQIGWPRSRPPASEPESDWVVLGSQRRSMDNFYSQKIWLMERDRPRFAYLVHFASFASGAAALPGGYVVGHQLRGTLSYHSAWNPLRADLAAQPLLDHDRVHDWHWLEAQAAPGLTEAIHHLQQRRIAYPFREQWPLLISGLRLVLKGGVLALADRQQVVMALDADFSGRTQLLQLMGQEATTLLLTTTNGKELLPWGGLFAGRWQALDLHDMGENA